MSVKVMLAAKAPEFSQLKLPILASPKLDGIRAFVHKKVVYSRNMKPIPSRMVQRLFGRKEFNGLDGELLACSPTDRQARNITSSACMRRDSDVVVQFHVFDDFLMDDVYGERLADLYLRQPMFREVCKQIRQVHHLLLRSAVDVEAQERIWLAEGYEGMILRDPDGFYKFGRSTAREGGMLKVKRFEDSEAVILEVIELQRNGNELQTDELGRAKRSSMQSGLTPGATAGAVRVRDCYSGVEFQIGTGFDDGARAWLWNNRSKVRGKVCNYKFFPHGVKNKPLLPVWDGIREDL